MGDERVTEAAEQAIDIDVKTRHMAEQSDAEQLRYAFAYTIRITNVGSVTATLRARRWLITDGDGRVEEVQGAGVVGEQPRLQPGESFEYTSGAVLRTPVGTMEGFYRMETDGGETFDAPIPVFSLRVPGSFN